MKLIPLAQEIWNKKYKAPSDQSISDMFVRVAKFISSTEPVNPELYYTDFHEILSNYKFFPGGRISNDAGVNNYLNNCYCIYIKDSIESIYDAIKKVAIISKTGGGCGFNISTLRPKDANLSGGGTASGAVSWLHIFDTSCGIIKTAGNRRAALISILDISHPDIYEYIDAKHEEGKLSNFNISVAIGDDFIKAVVEDYDWALTFGGKVYKVVRARELFNKLAESGLRNNDPGILWKDHINKYNDMIYLYMLDTCNPCGELSLPATEEFGEGSCCLGNVNITKFIRNPFYSNPEDFKNNFDVEEYKKTITTAVRFLDDVLDSSLYPYESNKRIAMNDRRIGLNHLSGVGSALAMLKIPYDSELAIDFVSWVSKIARDTSYLASIELAKEKGAFPNFNYDKYCQGGFFKTLPLDIRTLIMKYGIRNCAIGSIPPAGTGSILMNNISNGIEPFFMTEYNRNIKQPDGSLVTEAVEDYAWGMWKAHCFINDKPVGSPDWFKAAREISPQAHLKLQSTAQSFISGNISKTVNLPSSTTLEQYKEYILLSHKLECRGFTSFTEGTRDGVLVDKKETEAKLSVNVPQVSVSNVLPKRPRVLDGKVYQIPEGGGKHTYCTIAHIEQDDQLKPWEIFLNSSGSNDEWYAAVGRLASRLMRKTGDVQGVIDELREIGGQNGYLTKEYGYVQSRPQHISYILEEYMNSLKPIPSTLPEVLSYCKCPECGMNSYTKSGGCGVCTSCGYSTCG